MADVPLCPSLVAVIVAEPATTPVTKPLAETVATAALLVPHVTTRPLRAVPFASFGVAVTWVVAPTVRLADAGLSVTEATATFVTVAAAVPLCPSLVAVIVTAPTPSPVTSPVPLTAATPGALLDQVRTRPLSGLPRASFGVAVSCTVAPTTKLTIAGATVTEATGTFVTVTADVALFPSVVAVIVAEPAATPVTNPLAETVAAATLLVAHVTARPLRAVPFASCGVAVSWVVAPAVRLAAAGLTVTDATGTLLIVTAAVLASVPPLWVAITW